MILGICSLFLFFEEKYGLVEKLFGEFDKHIFEHVHMLLFVIVCLYVVVTVVLMAYCIHVANDYETIQKENDANQNKMKREWEDYDKKAKSMNRVFHAFYAAFNWSYGRAHFKFMYSQLRKQFEDQHKVEHKQIAEGQFDFHIYLRKCVRQACINIAMIHWQVWLTILIIIFLNTLRIIVFSTAEVSSFVILDASVLWGVTLYVFYLRHNATAALVAVCAQYEKYSKISHEAKEAEEEEEEEAEKDEEEARHHEDARIMSGGYCNKNRTTDQQKLFCLHSPASISRGLQLALLLISMSVPLYIMELSDSIKQDSGLTKILINCSIGIPPVLLLFVGIPPLIPRFVIATSVASMSRPSLIRATIERFEHLSHKSIKKAVHGHHDEEISISSEHAPMLDE